MNVEDIRKAIKGLKKGTPVRLRLESGPSGYGVELLGAAPSDDGKGLDVTLKVVDVVDADDGSIFYSLARLAMEHPPITWREQDARIAVTDNPSGGVEVNIMLNVPNEVCASVSVIGMKDDLFLYSAFGRQFESTFENIIKILGGVPR